MHQAKAQMQEKTEQSKIIVVSGPSGVGKSTICKEVAKRLDNIYLSISATTRPKGPGEIHGKDYWFMAREEFQKHVNEGLFLEHAEVFGNYYGTLKDKVEEALHEDKTVILEIDVQGAKQVKTVYPNAVMIFILPPSAKVLQDRIEHRGRDNNEVTEQRLNGVSSEIAAAWQYYEHMVINEDLQQAIKEVEEIIRSLQEQDDS